MPKVEPKFCHHCHTKKDCALCDSSEGCAKSYCATCIEKYGTTMAEVLKQQQWKCFGCRNECLCTGCRKRGRSTAEPVVPSIHPKFAAWFQAMGIPGDRYDATQMQRSAEACMQQHQCCSSAIPPPAALCCSTPAPRLSLPVPLRLLHSLSKAYPNHCVQTCGRSHLYPPD